MSRKKNLISWAVVVAVVVTAIIAWVYFLHPTSLNHPGKNQTQEISKNPSQTAQTQVPMPVSVIGQEDTVQLIRIRDGRLVLFESDFSNPCRVFLFDEDDGGLTLLGTTKLSHDNSRLFENKEGTIFLWGGVEYFCAGSYDAYRDTQNFESFSLAKGIGTPLPAPKGHHVGGGAVLLGDGRTVLVGGRQNLGPIWDQDGHWTGDKMPSDGWEVFANNLWTSNPSLGADLSWCVVGGQYPDGLMLWAGLLVPDSFGRLQPRLGEPLRIDLNSGELSSLGKVSWKDRSGWVRALPGGGGIRWDQETGQCFSHVGPADLEGKLIPGMIDNGFGPKIGGFEGEPLIQIPQAGTFWCINHSDGNWKLIHGIDELKNQEKPAFFWIGKDGRLRVITSGIKAAPVLKVYEKTLTQTFQIQISSRP